MGYCLWSFLSNSYTIQKYIQVPVCFYNVPETSVVESSQEYIKVKLSGKGSDLALCNNLAFHIDAHSLLEGKQIIVPNETNLFLPSTVKLVYSNPLHVSFKNKRS